MKNTIKLLGIIAIVAIIGFSMAACGDDDGGGGGLTITGLGSFNGKYAYAVSEGNIYAAKSLNMNANSITASKIDGGSVKLNVYQITSDHKANDYKGNDKVEFMVMILKVEKYDTNTSNSDLVGGGHVTVTFKNGVASGAFELYVDEDDED